MVNLRRRGPTSTAASARVPTPRSCGHAAEMEFYSISLNYFSSRGARQAAVRGLPHDLVHPGAGVGVLGRPFPCAAARPHSAALRIQVRLGRMLLEGGELARDERAAFGVSLGRGAAEPSEAMNMMGRCHENGWGVPVDLERAAASYRASAEGGRDWGQYNLGNLLFDGRGVAPDRLQALRWYLRAASQGHGRAMNIVARCLEEGWGCRRRREDAACWYQHSARSGYFRGQFNHALLLAERGLAESAADWFWEAASGGNAQMRRTIVAALAAAAHPALCQVRARVLALEADSSAMQIPVLCDDPSA